MPSNSASYNTQGPSWGKRGRASRLRRPARDRRIPGSDYSFNTPVNTRYVEIYVGSNYAGGDSYTGISQIRFDVAANVPVLPTATPVSIASGATLDLNGANQQVASLNDYVAGSQGTVTNSARPRDADPGGQRRIDRHLQRHDLRQPQRPAVPVEERQLHADPGRQQHLHGRHDDLGRRAAICQHRGPARLGRGDGQQRRHSGVSAGGANQFSNAASGPGSIGGVLAAAAWNPGSALGIDTTNAAGGVFTYSGSIGGTAAPASTAADSELRSHGCTTAVGTGGRVRQWAISASWFSCRRFWGSFIPVSFPRPVAFVGAPARSAKPSAVRGAQLKCP